jgi:HprK-related kinase A
VIERRLRIGPVAFRIGSAWQAPLDALGRLYEGYPRPTIADFTVRLEPERPWRRWLRPSVAIAGDFILPDAAPLALRHGLLAAEMGMNLQVALGERRFLVLHAAGLERDGRALLLTGESGAGKSTLAALLGECGWRLLGDEFALIDPDSLLVRPFPRAISLKNASVALLAGEVPDARLGPALADTPKGLIRHLRPRDDAIERMDEAARPAMLLFPRFGDAAAMRPVPPSERFVRLTQASPNLTELGEPGFTALAGVARLPSLAIDYPDTATALALVDQAWAAL